MEGMTREGGKGREGRAGIAGEGWDTPLLQTDCRHCMYTIKLKIQAGSQIQAGSPIQAGV